MITLWAVWPELGRLSPSIMGLCITKIATKCSNFGQQACAEQSLAPAGHWAGHSTEFVHPSQLSRGPVSSGPPTAPLLRSWQWQLEQENIPRVLLLCQGWLSEAMETPRFPQKAIVKFIRHHVLLWTVLRKQDLTDPQSTPFTSLANWEQRPSCKHLTNKQVQNTSCKD